MIKEIKDYIISNANNKLSDFNNKLIKTSLPIYGIKIPELRKLALNIARNDYHLFLEECDNSSYEMTILEAFVIGYARMSLEERFFYLDRFIPKIDNWAVHDGLVSTLKFTKNNMKEVYEYLGKYVDSKKEYEVRFVAIMLMSYYINDEYIDNNLAIVKKLYAKEYYAKMGVAWFLTTAASKYENKVFNYLENEVDKEIVSMTIRKIRDSYVVSSEFKNKVLQLKK